MSSAVVLLASLLALAAQGATAHMMMSSPAPRQSKGNPGPGGQIDYSYTAPLGTYPCKGYAAQAPVLTVAAGGSVPVSITGGANHGGGHCQFSISYDGDKTFVVLDTVIRECLRGGAGSFNVPIPATAPSGKATFMWTWYNAVGNRELYCNCADITVTGGSGPSGSLSGKAPLVANIPGTSFTFPEFNSGPDYHEQFDTTSAVTVTGNGSGGGSSSSPSSPASPPPPPLAASQPPAAPSTPSTPPAQQPQQPPAAPAPATPASSASAPSPAATPTDTPATGGNGGHAQHDGGASLPTPCKFGRYACAGPGTWGICVDAGRWVTFTTSPGLACQAEGDSIVFVTA